MEKCSDKDCNAPACYHIENRYLSAADAAYQGSIVCIEHFQKWQKIIDPKYYTWKEIQNPNFLEKAKAFW